MREPAVRGQFYPYKQSDIVELVEECFTSELGPGKLPSKVGDYKGKIKGAVVPHAGLVFSGHAAAHVYSALAKDGLPGTVVVVGPNHRGFGSPVAVATEDYDMPGGKLKTDRKLAEKLIGDVVMEDNMAHRYEHSLEVQLPFLQYLGGKFKLVTIAMGDQSRRTSLEVGKKLVSAADHGFVPLASSDFSHVGSNYGVKIPFGLNAGKFAKKQDKHALKAIQEMDIDGMYAARKEYGITMCGYGAIAAVMKYAKAQGATKGKLLQYYSSHDIMPGGSAVGYAGIIFV